MRQSEVLKIDLEYGFKPNPQQLALIEELSQSPKSIELEPDGSIGWQVRHLEITLEEAFSITDKFNVTGRTGMARFHDEPDLSEIIQKSQMPSPVNIPCNVVVADGALLKINNVTHCNDYCTDSLQQMLNGGWRILAICVQPDQRRPDYVFGRTSL